MRSYSVSKPPNFTTVAKVRKPLVREKNRNARRIAAIPRLRCPSDSTSERLRLGLRWTIVIRSPSITCPIDRGDVNMNRKNLNRHVSEVNINAKISSYHFATHDRCIEINHFSSLYSPHRLPDLLGLGRQEIIICTRIGYYTRLPKKIL